MDGWEQTGIVVLHGQIGTDLCVCMGAAFPYSRGQGPLPWISPACLKISGGD